MAHLTEETQPSFESTLKSRAVSEASNVKFICVVTGKLSTVQHFICNYVLNVNVCNVICPFSDFFRVSLL